MNPWPGNLEGLVQLPRLRTSGPVSGGGGQVSLPPGPNWSGVVWSLVANSFSTGTASSTLRGSNFSFSAQGFAGGHSSFTRALGTLSYSGPAAHCVISIVTTAGNTGVNMGLFIHQDATGLLTINTAQIDVPGTYSFPFVVAATTGSSITITGLTDIGQPSRLFVFSSNGFLGAFSGSIRNVI